MGWYIMKAKQQQTLNSMRLSIPRHYSQARVDEIVASNHHGSIPMDPNLQGTVEGKYDVEVSFR
jgi:hypothetical protein